MFSYKLGVHPAKVAEFDYYEIKGLEFPNPIHAGDFIRYKGADLEVKNVVHEHNMHSLVNIVSSRVV